MGERAIYWRCFHCGDAFTKAQEKHARAHFGVGEDALPVCQLRLPGEYHLLNILRKQEDELRAFYSEDTELWRAIHAQAADHAQALWREEERGYAKGVADVRSEDGAAQADAASWKADAAGLHLENERLREALLRICALLPVAGNHIGDAQDIARTAISINPAGDGTGSSSADVALSLLGDSTEMEGY